MFVRASTLVLAIAASAIAAPGSTTPTTGTSSECDVSDMQCCNGSSPASSIPSEVLGLLGISVPVGGSVAFGCSPITALGLGSGSSCKQQAICCSNNDATGLINVVCSPTDLSL